MKLISVTMEGFKSFQKGVRFEFGSKTPGSLNFLTGRNEVETELGANGAGKSTVWDAVYWCFYGKTARKLKASNVMTWRYKVRCEVTVEFDIGRGEMALTRTQSPNSLKLVKEGDPDGFMGNDITQEEVEDLIGIGPDPFLHAIFISQTSRMFFDLESTAKLELFSAVMGLDAWGDFSDRAAKVAKSMEASIQKFENDLANYRGQLEQLDTADYSNDIAEWDENRSLQIENYRKEFEEILAKRKQVKADYQSLEGDIAGHRKDRAEIIAAKKGKDERKQDLERLRNTASTDLARVDTKISANDKAISNMQQMSVCPNCQQSVPDSHKKRHIAHLKSLGDTLMAERTSILAERTQHVAQLESINRELADLQAKSEKYARKIDEMVSDLNRLSNQLTGYDTKLDNIEEQVGRLEEATNPFLSKQQLVEEEQKRLNGLIAASTENLESARKSHSHHSFWVKGFKEVRLYMISTALTQLEVEVNSCLSELGLVDWTISFAVDQETKSNTIKKGFHVMIKSPYNDELVPWESWSGGESQRLRIAGTMGLSNLILNSLGVSCNVEIWDEPSTWLSKEGISDLLEALHRRAVQGGKDIWLVDHRSLEFGKFKNIVTVVKDNTGSYIR